MLGKMITHYKDDVAVVAATFDEEDGTEDVMGIDTTYLKRCKCFLGSAAEHGFEYVKMNEPGPQGLCGEKKRISSTKLSPDYYKGVCDTLLFQGCQGLSGRVLLTKRVD